MAPTKTDKVKKEAADNSTPLQAAGNALPALRSGASCGGAVSARGASSAAARGGIGKARRGGSAVLGARNAVPCVADAVGRVLGLAATPSPGPATASPQTSAPASTSASSTTAAAKTAVAAKTTTAAKTNNKPLKQQATMAPQPKPDAVASDKERRYTQGDLSLLKSGDLHDALIVSNEVTWKVHKTILYPRSEWFRDAFSNPVEVSHVTLPSLCLLERMQSDVSSSGRTPPRDQSLQLRGRRH